MPNDANIAIPIAEERKRRRSFMEYGGKNSINNFVSSYQKAQNFLNINNSRATESSAVNSNTSTFLQPVSNYESISDDQSVDSSFNLESHVDVNYINPTTSRDSQIMDEESQLLQNHKHSDQATGIITGRSTSAQTIFNSINTLVGIGILSLPFGFRLAGWIPGFVILLLCALSTNFTAKLLGEILVRHPQLKSYGDIAKYSFGSNVHFIVCIIFSMDLLCAAISLVLLFADSFNILFTDVDKSIFKCVICVLILILCLLPLNILSIFSLLGIISTTGVVLSVMLCGFSTTSSPGSLLNFESTSLWPKEPKYVLLALGILICPWGGHPVFPELYREMKSPAKYNKCVSITFTFTYFLDLLMSTVGYLMFGFNIEDEVTKNLMINENYPTWIGPSVCILMAVLPIAKAPLVVRPVITAVEQLLQIESQSNTLTLKRFSVKAFVCGLVFVVSLTFTSFGRIMAFLGSAICFTICITLPLLFYLKIFSKNLSFVTKIYFKIGISVAVICAVLGTYAAFYVEI